ncbi:hypothetical protein J40TS1_31800 [Paenibacillus montaniterrae]|uniref:Uncharacterized protein n=1 Tax=Paenibacillus montaniterrae TaxID=429341 RepID=A0A919YVF0_9BACL|nr:hypothetical protein [Paenibacillus montaniterrae]GIP17538.1 hypothetical protein J40TS1_31800 [Paenibacillus montaniterrae]
MEQLERQTYLMKLMLVLMRDRKARQAQVRSVGYLREYGELPEDMGVNTLGKLTDEALQALAEQIGMKKRPAGGKSDIYMNDLGYVLVSTEAVTSLMENADEQDLLELADHLQLSRSIVAPTLERLREKQAAQSTSELVVSLASADGAFQSEQKQWAKLISYWWCNGSANAPSKFPAELVLSYADPLNMNTWDIVEPDAYLDSRWERLQLKLDREHRLSIFLD